MLFTCYRIDIHRRIERIEPLGKRSRASAVADVVGVLTLADIVFVAITLVAHLRLTSRPSPANRRFHPQNVLTHSEIHCFMPQYVKSMTYTCRCRPQNMQFL